MPHFTHDHFTHDRIIRLLDAGRTSLSEAERILRTTEDELDRSGLRRLSELLDQLDDLIVRVEPDGSRYDAIVSRHRSGT